MIFIISLYNGIFCLVAKLELIQTYSILCYQAQVRSIPHEDTFYGITSSVRVVALYNYTKKKAFVDSRSFE